MLCNPARSRSHGEGAHLQTPARETDIQTERKFYMDENSSLLSVGEDCEPPARERVCERE
jgi:hypothetical protein